MRNLPRENLCNAGHEMTYESGSKRHQLKCDACLQNIIVKKGYLSCGKCYEDYCIKCTKARANGDFYCGKQVGHGQHCGPHDENSVYSGRQEKCRVCEQRSKQRNPPRLCNSNHNLTRLFNRPLNGRIICDACRKVLDDYDFKEGYLNCQ